MPLRQTTNELLQRLHIWREQAPDRELARIARQIIAQRNAEKDLSCWVDMSTDNQFARLNLALLNGANPQMMLSVDGKPEQPIVEAVAFGSPRCAMRLLDAGAPITQELFQTIAAHAIYHLNDKDHARVDLLSEKSEEWDAFHMEEGQEIEFPWMPLIGALIAQPGLDWYARLDNRSIPQAFQDPCIGSYTPLVALDSKRAIQWDLKKQLHLAQAERGEYVGRPPLPKDMSQAQIDELFRKTYDYYDKNAEFLDPEDRKARKLELLALGANPNGKARAWDNETYTENAMANVYAQESIAELNSLISAGGKITANSVNKSVDSFISMVNMERNPHNPNNRYSEKEIEEIVARAEKYLGRHEAILIQALTIADIQGIRLADLNGGDRARKIEEVRPGFMVRLEHGGLMSQTAAAPKATTKARRL